METLRKSFMLDKLESQKKFFPIFLMEKPYYTSKTFLKSCQAINQAIFSERTQQTARDQYFAKHL